MIKRIKNFLVSKELSESGKKRLIITNLIVLTIILFALAIFSGTTDPCPQRWYFRIAFGGMIIVWISIVFSIEVHFEIIKYWWVCVFIVRLMLLGYVFGLHLSLR